MAYKLGLGRWADYIGIAAICWFLYRDVNFYFFPKPNALKRYKRSPKAYALITAASGGIGYGYAQELLRHGFGVILLANKKEKLANAAAKLKAENEDAAIETISFDCTSGKYDELEELLKPYLHLPITILVNNVGGVSASEAFQTLSQYSMRDVEQTIHLNIGVMTHLSRILQPTLTRNGPSVALHMSSGTQLGMPWLDVYSGCKGYVNSFATALSREAKLEGWNIDSIAVMTGDVQSEGNKAGLGVGTPTSRQYAKMVLDRIELAADRNLTMITPYWLHAIQIGILKQLPESAANYLLASNMRHKKAAFIEAKKKE